jgi:3-methyladenine DNA glycosylase/8-oxoguanine DNA glycosylase
LPLTSTVVPVSPFSFRRSLALQTVGAYDPTGTLNDDRFDKVFHASGDVCRVSIASAPDGLLLQCEGSGAAQVTGDLVAAFAADDGHNSFNPGHTLIRKLHRDQPGLRLIRVPWMFDIACSAVLQQRVRFVDACRDWRHIAERFGTRTTSGAVAFPPPEGLAAVPAHALAALGIDAQRSRALLALAKEIRMYPLRANMTYAQLRARLSRIPGIGPWTVETILGFGAADPDAVPIGDLYLPHLVGYALAGENPSTDERMIALLEPWRGQRFRVVRLLQAAKIDVSRTPRPTHNSW